MERKTPSRIMLTLLFTGMFALTFNIQTVKASGTVYIRPDGSIDPPTAPIQRDGDVYTFTNDIYDEIVVEKDDIIVDGDEYTLQGAGTGNGFYLYGRTNVTIKAVKIIQFYTGIYLAYSSYNAIIGNFLSLNSQGINLYESTNNAVSNNSVTLNQGGIIVYQGSHFTMVENNTVDSNTFGISLGMVNWCTITLNNLANNFVQGVGLEYSDSNSIVRNTIANTNYWGIELYYSDNNGIIENNLMDTVNGSGVFIHYSRGNELDHNNFLNNSIRQVYVYISLETIWDNGYPSGGNYWSDYVKRYADAAELDDSGIWDTPYVIDENNQDNYPLMEPWSPTPPFPANIGDLKTKIEELGSEGEIDNRGIVKSLIAKLNTAQKLVDKENIDEATMVLQDFIQQVQELSGIHITTEAADILTQSAEYIIFNL